MKENEKKIKNGKSKLGIAIVIVLVAALLAFGYWYFFAKGIVYSDDARFDADLVDVSPRIGGTLEKIFVQEGDTVAQNQLLFLMDKKSVEESLAKAEADRFSKIAEVSAAQAQYQKAVNGSRQEEIQMAEAAYRKAEATEQLAAADWARIKSLFDRNMISVAERDRVQTSWQTAKEALDQARENLRLLQSGTRPEDIEAARANLNLSRGEVASATASVGVEEVNLSYTEIRAPFNGVIVRRWKDQGAILSTGTPVLTLMNPATLYVSANIPERKLGKVAVGDPVDISIDAYPHHRLKGHVETILRAANSKFSVIPSEGTSGTFIKVEQRVPIRIRLDAIPDLPIGPGLSVVVRIHTDRSSK